LEINLVNEHAEVSLSAQVHFIADPRRIDSNMGTNGPLYISVMAEHDRMIWIITTAKIMCKVILDWYRTCDEWVGCNGQARCAQGGNSLPVE
jgi:hypothetical protein